MEYTQITDKMIAAIEIENTKVELYEITLMPTVGINNQKSEKGRITLFVAILNGSQLCMKLIKQKH